jgi:enoyl ACP reductase
VLLQGKKIVVTGILNRASIAYAIADECQKAGAEIVTTSFGRVRSITEMTVKRLSPVPDILELDVTRPEDIEGVRVELDKRWGTLDGLVHSLAFAPEDALGGNFLKTPWASASTAFQVSAFSLKEVAAGLAPLMREHGGSIVTLDFDNSSQAWPSYDWMGVSKAALQAVMRYLARDLGPDNIRVNAIAAGPIRSIAARGVPGFDKVVDAWSAQAPLAWDVKDPYPVAKTAVALLSDWMPKVTGETIHVDGGYHAMGAQLPPDEAPETIP